MQSLINKEYPGTCTCILKNNWKSFSQEYLCTLLICYIVIFLGKNPLTVYIKVYSTVTLVTRLKWYIEGLKVKLFQEFIRDPKGLKF